MQVLYSSIAKYMSFQIYVCKLKLNCAPVSDHFVQICYYLGLTVPRSYSLREKTLFVSCCLGKRCSASPTKGKESKRGARALNLTL